MPAKSKQQFKLMKGIAEGSIKHRKGLPSRKAAQEFIDHQSPKHLPRRVKKK